MANIRVIWSLPFTLTLLSCICLMTSVNAWEGGEVQLSQPFEKQPSWSFTSTIIFDKNAPKNAMCGISYQTSADLVTIYLTANKVGEEMEQQVHVKWRETDDMTWDDLASIHEYTKDVTFTGKLGTPIKLFIDVKMKGRSLYAGLGVVEGRNWTILSTRQITKPLNSFTLATFLMRQKQRLQVQPVTLCTISKPQFYTPFSSSYNLNKPVSAQFVTKQEIDSSNTFATTTNSKITIKVGVDKVRTQLTELLLPAPSQGVRVKRHTGLESIDDAILYLRKLSLRMKKRLV